ncbi:hypothetical protein HDU96_002769 [Phlyctochytrium bullatum]|nr:hypothetical protein HDU96_002769 [Phlyctochytrium bullatum]
MKKENETDQIQVPGASRRNRRSKRRRGSLQGRGDGGVDGSGDHTQKAAADQEIPTVVTDISPNVEDVDDGDDVPEIEVVDLTLSDDEIPSSNKPLKFFNLTIPLTTIRASILDDIRSASTELSTLEDSLLDLILQQTSSRRRRSSALARTMPLNPAAVTTLNRTAALLADLFQSLPAKPTLVSVDGNPVTLPLLASIVAPGTWLDDEAVNSFMGLLGRTYPKVKFMSTFFHARLTGSAVRGKKKKRKKKNGEVKVAGEDGYCYDAVKKWTKKTPRGIFDYEKVVVPINQSNRHWSLVHIDLLNHRIESYDSLNNPSFSSKAVAIFKRYLHDEHADKHPKSVPTPDFSAWSTSHRSSPAQTDGSSCGVFVCLYARCVAEGDAPAFSQNDVGAFRRKMAWCLCKGVVQALWESEAWREAEKREGTVGWVGGGVEG